MKRRRSTWTVVVLGTSCATACASSFTDEADTTNAAASAIECEVAIVGGGAGGLHTAFRLADTLGAKVCLFEKERELGGRIHDVTLMDVDDPGAPRIGLGARRVMETQDVLFSLATELGLELEKPEGAADLIQARGIFSFSKDDIAARAYPTIPPATADKDRETLLLDTLRASPERARITEYADFASYSKAVIGDEAYTFLRDMSRFRADFEYPLDARGYLDYFDEEWDTCCAPSYPKGGMSSFIRAMEARATARGARIYKDEPVSTIVKVGSEYRVTTGHHTATAKKVVIAVPPVGLDKIGGDVAERIKAQRPYRDIVGVHVVTITQSWAEAWWKTVKNPAVETNAQVWRAWTTDHCLNFIEIPIEPYAAAQNVTRSVYVDNERCATYWEGLASQGVDKVEEALQAELTAVFNNGGVSVPEVVAIPKPLKTVVQTWPAAWYWLRAGATITNKELAEWAVEPLPGEAVGLVGEAYNVQRSGWSDGAYKSSIQLLNAKYGLALPGLKPRSAPMLSLGRRSLGGR
jgi:hypothetical protein